MFHRITLEAGKLNSARLVKPNPKSLENQDRQNSNTHYEELSLTQEAETFFRGNKLPLTFVLYLVIGSVFYHYDYQKKTVTLTADGRGRTNPVFGFFEAVTIGYSVGLSNKDPSYIPDPWFSSAYILVGAGLIALNLVVIGRKLEDKASNVVFDGLKRREDYEKDMSHENPIYKRTLAFLKYNAPYLLVILLWISWLAFTTVWSMFATLNDEDPKDSWDFAYAQYFAVSLCSSAGSFSLPRATADWGYGMAAISMMIGVPLMALAISSIVIMLSQGHRFKKVKKAAWEPVQLNELEAIKQLGLNEGDGDTITKGGFVLLGLLRMGQDSGIIQYLADAYDASEERGGVPITSSIHSHSDDDYSKRARAYLDRAASISNRSGKTKPGINQEDRRWSTAAIKDDSARSEGAVPEALTEPLLASDDSETSLHHRSTLTDVSDETEKV